MRENRSGRGPGGVYTRPWAVELVLDLAGYVSDADLGSGLAVEPACGSGAFVTVMVKRLLDSLELYGRSIAESRDVIRAYDIDTDAVTECRSRVEHLLGEAGVDGPLASDLARSWIRSDDFLLGPSLPTPATWVVGNPPYVRIEEVDRELLTEYRSRWSTMSGRADVYVGFFEAGLGLLTPGGHLAYLCTDRWMRNAYGSKLRSLIADKYALKACCLVHASDAFEHRVATYPAIVVISADVQSAVLSVDASSEIDSGSAASLLKVFNNGPVGDIVPDKAFSAFWMPGWHSGSESWPWLDSARLEELRSLQAEHPALEDAGVRVSVGVATGADNIYITEDYHEIEPSRLLPSVSAKQVSGGQISWDGRMLVNTWDADGLISLDDYPGLAGYFRNHESRIRERSVAKLNPKTWWRSLDRVDPDLVALPKLLLPDIKNRLFPVLDPGGYCPSHSLYYLTSTRWDLEVLGGLLMSDIANMFVEAYSVKMQQGYFRVSAQYLRRIRVPEPESISEAVSMKLRESFRSRDSIGANAAAREAYGV